MDLKLVGLEDHNLEKAEESIEDLIESNKLCSLATVDENGESNRPHIATAFYCFDDKFNFYILTEPDTEHCQHLEENNSIALSIYDSHQEWTDEKQGLQVFGKAEKVEGEEISRALELYLERFPELELYASDKEEVKKNLDSSFYRITPDRIKIFDEPRFGRETWVEVEVK